MYGSGFLMVCTLQFTVNHFCKLLLLRTVFIINAHFVFHDVIMYCRQNALINRLWNEHKDEKGHI